MPERPRLRAPQQNQQLLWRLLMPKQLPFPHLRNKRFADFFYRSEYASFVDKRSKLKSLIYPTYQFFNDRFLILIQTHPETPAETPRFGLFSSLRKTVGDMAKNLPSQLTAAATPAQPSTSTPAHDDPKAKTALFKDEPTTPSGDHSEPYSQEAFIQQVVRILQYLQFELKFYRPRRSRNIKQTWKSWWDHTKIWRFVFNYFEIFVNDFKAQHEQVQAELAQSKRKIVDLEEGWFKFFRWIVV